MKKFYVMTVTIVPWHGDQTRRQPVTVTGTSELDGSGIYFEALEKAKKQLSEHAKRYGRCTYVIDFFGVW